MPHQLPPRVHRDTQMEFDVSHLKRGTVSLAHEVADEPLVLMDAARTLSIGDAGRLNDRLIAPLVVDHADESVVEHAKRLA